MGWRKDARSTAVAETTAARLLEIERIAGEFADVRLRDFLVDTGPPAVLPTACKNPDACRREIEARQAWWLPTAECLEIELVAEAAPPHYVYRLNLRTNQTLTKGDVETIVAKGIPAMHRARGERAPCDCIAAQEGDTDENA